MSKKKKMTQSLINPPKPSRSQPEKKNVDIIVAGPITFSQSTANLALLNGNTYGNTATTHVGRKIRMTSIQFRWRGGRNTGGTTSTGQSPLRMLVVYDKQANHAAPTAVQICTVDSIVSPMNLNFSQRFVVLFDEIIAPYSAGQGESDNSFYRKGYKATNLVTEFNAGSVGDITDIETGSIYALFWQDGNIAVGTPSNSVYFRMKYEDV